MKYVVIRDGENIKHIEPINLELDFVIEDVVVIDKLPVLRRPVGKIPRLIYTETEGVHFEYSDAPVSEQISGKELMDMIKEVL